jgi:cell division protein FtsN
LQGFFNAITLVMEEGFALAAFIALILNLILPEEFEDEEIPELTANTIDAPADEEEWRHIRRDITHQELSQRNNHLEAFITFMA